MQRGCAALLIRGTENTLIDAGPDLRMQLSHAGAQDVERVLFTHEHFDHIGGIPQLEYYVLLKSKKPLPLYAGERTLAAIEQQFAFMADTLAPQLIEEWQCIEFDGVRYTPLPATHGEQTFGFLIEKNIDITANEASRLAGTTTIQTDQSKARIKRIAYFPDTGPLSAEVMRQLRGIDILIIDATFNGSNWMPDSHLNIDEAIALAQKLKAKKTFLTHLSMHYDEPITAAELQALLTPYEGSILAANDGLEIPL